MKKNSYLEAADKMLKKQKYHTKFRDENLLEIAMDKKEKVFAYLAIEQDQFPGIIMSLAYDFGETYVIANLTIDLMHLVPVTLGEPFFRSKNGTLYWGTDAAKYFALEFNNQFLKEVEPVSKDLH